MHSWPDNNLSSHIMLAYLFQYFYKPGLLGSNLIRKNIGIIKHVKHTERHQTSCSKIFQKLSSSTSILRVTGLVILKVFYIYSLRLTLCKLMQVRAQQGDNRLK